MTPLSVTTSLVPYVPRLALEWDQRIGSARAAILEGSMVFVDLSGFTALSERLARLGREGAEQVTAVIDDTFTDLLDAAYSVGGALLKFGGDALLLFFEGDSHPLRAASAAHDMRARLRARGPAVTPAGKATLRMSVGAHTGLFHFFRLGERHLELLVTGPAATELGTMEAAASAGQILLSPPLAARLPPRSRGRALGPGVLLAGRPEVDSSPIVPVDAGIDAIMAIPEPLRDAIANGAVDAEHRSAAVAFVHFDGTDALIASEGPARVADRLHTLITTTQEVLARHDLCLLSSDIDKDGGKLILTAGVPTAHEDDEDRLLRSVREIVDEVTAVDIRVGVNRGTLFAGAVGPPHRRTYTIMGDTVNTAARVMAHARAGQILVTPAVVERVRSRFALAAVEPFAAKGKAQLLQASILGALDQDHEVVEHRTADDTFVGRERELETLRQWLAERGARSTSVAEVRGPAGIGKTRLVEELHAEVPWTARAVADPYRTGAPYLAFRKAVIERLAEAWPARSAEASLAELLGADAPFAGRALGIEAAAAGVPDLPPAILRSRSSTAMLRLLDHITPPDGLWVVEHAGWLDDDSVGMLDELSQSPRAWCAVVLHRGERLFSGSLQVALDPLDRPNAASLVAALGAGTLLPVEQRAIVDKGDGNPLFLRELVRSALAHDVADLPDSMDGLAAAAIDTLPAGARNQLRRLSVLGLEFDDRAAAVVLGGARVDHGALTDFLETTGSGVRFRQELHRAAAYEGLPYRTRRALHLDVARDLEARGVGPALCAHHYHRAGDWPRAWRHAMAGAERARTNQALVEAAAMYEIAAQVPARTPGISARERASAWAELAWVLGELGRHDEGEAALRRARRLAGDDHEILARIALLSSLNRHVTGQPVAARRWVNRGRRLAEGLASADGRRTAARLALQSAVLDFNHGRMAKAERGFRQALLEANGSGDVVAAAHACNWLLQTLSKLRSDEALAFGDRAISLYEAASVGWMAGYVLSNVGNHLRADGRWDEAIDHFQRASERLEALGDLLSVAVIENNVGELLADQGRWAEASEHLGTSLANLRAAGHVYVHAVASNLARIEGYRGDHEAANRLRELAAHLRKAGLEGLCTEALLRAVELDLLREVVPTDLPPIEQTTPLLTTLATRIHGLAAAVAGAEDQAAEALRSAARHARAATLPFEEACALDALASVTGDEDPAQMAKEIFNRLGVVTPPPLPKLRMTRSLDKSPKSNMHYQTAPVMPARQEEP